MTNNLKGILLIDKPKGKTSPEITQEISRTLNTKAGHCGALDPFATGILPITIGKAVKIQEHLQKKKKEYYVEIETNEEIPKEKMKKNLEKFKGTIKQVPPKKSAVKRKERTRKIYKIDYLEKKKKKHTFIVKCQHGTYIRTLVKDLSKEIGTNTKLINLRRLKTGKWNVKQAKKLKEIKKETTHKNTLIPLKNALKDLPSIEIKETALKSIKHGRNLKIPGIKKVTGKPTKNNTITIKFHGEVIALGKAKMNQKEIQKRNTGTVIKTQKVIV